MTLPSIYIYIYIYIIAMAMGDPKTIYSHRIKLILLSTFSFSFNNKIGEKKKGKFCPMRMQVKAARMLILLDG